MQIDLLFRPVKHLDLILQLLYYFCIELHLFPSSQVNSLSLRPGVWIKLCRDIEILRGSPVECDGPGTHKDCQINWLLISAFYI